MEYVSLGVIKDSFGLDGTLKIYSTTNNQSIRYKAGAKVFLFNPLEGTRIEYIVRAFRHNGLFDYVKLDGIDSPEQVKLLKSYEIHAKKDKNDLEKGKYFYSDLRGCDVVDSKGAILGKVKEIEEFPAQLTLRVSRSKKPDFFVPFIEEFIKEVDIENKTICIEIIEGLL